MIRTPYILLTLLSLSSYPAFAAITVSSVPELVSAVNNTATGGDKTILIADGSYALAGQYLRIASNGVTVRSASGDRSKVILDGGYQTTEIFQIVASDVRLQDITLKRAKDHPIHVMGGASSNTLNILIDDIHIIDPGEQAIKINTSGAYAAHFGTIRNSLIELTANGRDYVENDHSNGHPCYTGGIDAHGANGWRIQDNEIRGFWCQTGLSEHAVHFWSSSSNTLVERNLIIDCDRGVGFGLGERGHSGGTIRNNMISQLIDHGHSDVGIGLESAGGARVYNNSIYMGHDYPNAIEYRFPASNSLTIVNNLSNRAISSRNGGSATLISHNRSNASAAWFSSIAKGDLHLASERLGVSGAARAVSGLVDDFDKQERPPGTGLDIGADEYSSEQNPGIKALPASHYILLSTQ